MRPIIAIYDGRFIERQTIEAKRDGLHSLDRGLPVQVHESDYIKSERDRVIRERFPERFCCDEE